MTTYRVAEKFKSIQGEGVYTGTPMAFIRFVGCSVGKRICQHCDTDFDEVMPWRGGGEFSARDLAFWFRDYQHVCFTGGEPLDQDLLPIMECMRLSQVYEDHGKTFHIETSGTKVLTPIQSTHYKPEHQLWVCVSPKPGFLEDVVMAAHEVKVIVPGLGKITASAILQLQRDEQDIPDDFRWPTPDDALRWARAGKIVFLQPRNAKHDIDHVNLGLVQDIIREHPELRLSVQLHKVLKVQ